MTRRSLYNGSSIFAARRLTRYLPQSRHAPNFGSRRIQHEKVSSPLFIYKWTVLPHVNEQEQKQRVCSILTTRTPCRNHKRHSLNTNEICEIALLICISEVSSELIANLLPICNPVDWEVAKNTVMDSHRTGPLRLDTFRLIQQT